jgi:hydrogenase nickel incorporation protein HypA/HybF
MHELSVCQSMMRQLEDIAVQHAAKSVSTVRVSIGPLSGVEPQLLLQAFSVAAAGSVAEHATLVMDTLPVRVLCRQCGAETDAVINRLVCGECSAWQTRLVSGDEMLLASVELET